MITYLQHSDPTVPIYRVSPCLDRPHVDADTASVVGPVDVPARRIGHRRPANLWLGRTILLAWSACV